MLEIKNLSFSYSRSTPIIRNVSMNIEKGTVCGLLGKNGAGKTTLLYLICGLLKPSSGIISFEGLTPFRRQLQFLREVFIVPEEFSLPSVRLSEFVEVNAPFYPRFDVEQMHHYLELFELDANLHLGQLSMGQKKKTFISFAMACNTSLLLLDEPTNGLDISSKRTFRRCVAECMTDEKSILISTHQVYDVDKILDHIIITDRSGVMMDASVNTIMDNLAFHFTTDRERAEKSLIGLEVPGGYNVAELIKPGDEETDINLETLFELVQKGYRLPETKNLN